MELISHLGISPVSEPTLRSTVLQLRGYLVLWILLRFTVAYHLLSAMCSSFSLFYFETEYIKRTACFLFWNGVSLFMKWNNVTVKITGDALSARSAIVICNHQSLADYAILAQLTDCCGSLRPQPSFFTWFSLWRVPTIKTVYNMLKCDENWELHKSWADSIFRRVMSSDTPEWVILFPEVNIKTPTVTFFQKAQSKRYYLPEFENILYPRFSGLHSAVDSLCRTPESKFETLYDITIRYEPAPPNLMQFFAASRPIIVNVHVIAKPLSRVPHKRSKLEKWLENAWIDKDKLLSSRSFEQDVIGNAEAQQSLLDIPIASIWKKKVSFWGSKKD